MKTAEILGVKLNEVNLRQALDIMEALLNSGKTHLLVTLSSEMLLYAQKNPEFKAVINSASLVVPDAEGVLWAGKSKGLNLTEKVAGIDLIKNFFPRAAEKGYKIFLLGAKPGMAEKAALNLKTLYPGLQIVGNRHGYFSEDAQVLAEISRAKPDLLIIAMGSPKQETWFYRHKAELPPLLAIGVGGALDVLAGELNRAPEFLIKLKLEWLYRFFKEPGRIFRILPLVYLPFLILTDKKRGGGGGGPK